MRKPGNHPTVIRLVESLWSFREAAQQLKAERASTKRQRKHAITCPCQRCCVQQALNLVRPLVLLLERLTGDLEACLWKVSNVEANFESRRRLPYQAVQSCN